MEIKNYSPTSPNFWNGRIDDINDPDSFRMHQVVKLIDLNEVTGFNIYPESVNVCFIGFCCDEGITRNMGRKGAAQGPEYIRKEFANLPVTFGTKVSLYDAGDIACIGNKMEEAQEQLALAINTILQQGLFPIVLGGGHELAFGHYNGIIGFLKNKSEANNSLGIINFDAHFDLRPYAEQGSSGTMFAQIADQCKEEERNFSYLCIGIQQAANTISLFKKADSLGIKYILAKELSEANLETVGEKIQDFANKHEHLYLTICSDLINAASAPGVSAMQPFGVNPEMVLLLIKEVLKTKKTISLDIAEISPRFDQDNRTAKLGAIMIYGIINALVEN